MKRCSYIGVVFRVVHCCDRYDGFTETGIWKQEINHYFAIKKSLEKESFKKNSDLPMDMKPLNLLTPEFQVGLRSDLQV